VNPEFVGAVRLKKLLAGEFEPSGVKEKGLGLASSMSCLVSTELLALYLFVGLP